MVKIVDTSRCTALGINTTLLKNERSQNLVDLVACNSAHAHRSPQQGISGIVVLIITVNNLEHCKISSACASVHDEQKAPTQSPRVIRSSSYLRIKARRTGRDWLSDVCTLSQ